MEFRALVLQYMSNGSLEKWLYSHNYCLNLVQRVSIMVDVALALDYLHNGQSELVVHCDLKPNNILLDEHMVAHVGDFGIVKILVKNKDVTQTKTLGTIGYIAPSILIHLYLFNYWANFMNNLNSGHLQEKQCVMCASFH